MPASGAKELTTTRQFVAVLGCVAALAVAEHVLLRLLGGMLP